MPRLACWSCGRQIYTVTPLESLFAEERRCPRCGAFLHDERRENDRRSFIRRNNPDDEPGPPTGAEERRTAQRRQGRRRGGGTPSRWFRGRTGLMRIGFLGFGLIGGSVARAVREGQSDAPWTMASVDSVWSGAAPGRR